MLPRQADVAFVLEGVPGLRDVYALDRRSAGDLELAVRLEHGGRHIALAHYALLRVLTHEECTTVLACFSWPTTVSGSFSSQASTSSAVGPASCAGPSTSTH